MGSATSASYYALAPAPGWRLLMLDAYDVSLLGWSPGHPHHAQAVAILDERNPNAVRPAEHVCGFFGALTAEVHMRVRSAPFSLAKCLRDCAQVAGLLLYPDPGMAGCICKCVSCVGACTGSNAGVAPISHLSKGTGCKNSP